MIEPTYIEIALEHNDTNKIKDFIKSGENIYKEFAKESHFYVKETLLTRACREERSEIVEILLNVYEKDYKIAEKCVSSEKDKDFLLKYIFIASSDEEIQEVLKLSTKSQNSFKKSLVFLADRQECVLVSIVQNKDLIFRLHKNGFLTINSREKNGGNPGYLVGAMNRLDLLKRMVAIGLNYKVTLPSCEGNDLNFIGKIINETKCIGLLKYCLTELNLDHEDLLQFTSKNKSIDIFEFLLEYVCHKNGSSNKKLYIQQYCENINVLFTAQCGSMRNFKLVAHIFTVYNVTLENKQIFFSYFLKESKSGYYIKKILEIGKENFDDLLNSMEMDTNLTVLEETWRALDKSTLKMINKDNVKMIIVMYITNEYFRSQTRAYFDMVDPLAIYDEERGSTALFIALERNCEPLVRHLISKGADLLHKNKEGHTTLTAACKYCTPEIIRLLLKTADKSLINEIGSDGYYPLTELINRDESFVDVFKKIIKKGANIHVLDPVKNTLLHNAVQAQSIEFVKACLEVGVDPSIKGYNGNTALHISTKEKSVDIFDFILNSGKVDIETKNYRGNTILHNVAKAHTLPHFFFSFVKKTKPNVNALNNEGQSPIYFCFENDKFKKLLEMGADTTIVGENYFPFYTAAAFKCINKIFSNPDIDLSITDNDEHLVLHSIPGITIPVGNFLKKQNFKDMLGKYTNYVSEDEKTSVFQKAAATNNLYLLKNMFKYGEPQLELTNNYGETAIFGNLRYCFHKDVLEYLIEKGANVNAQNNDGNSLIFISVFAEGTEILLKAGASTHIRNKKEESALHIAAQKNNLEICLLLLKYGADLNVKDENNKKPSDLCTSEYLKDFLLFISD